MKLTIEAMTAADYDEIAALWESTPGVGISPADSRSEVTRFLERNPGLSHVARNEGRLVGAALCGHDGRRGYISHLAVDVEHRREGIGGLLVARCVQALTRESIEKCHVFVFGDNTEALAFWRDREWVEREELKLLSKLTGS